MLCRPSQLSPLVSAGMSQSPWEGTFPSERKQGKEENSDPWKPTLVNRLESGVGGGWGEHLSFLDSQSGRRASSVCGPGEQGPGKSWRHPSSSLPLTPSFPICSGCALLSCPTELCGKKHCINNKIIKGMSGSEQEGGRNGSFWQQHPIIRASVLPSTCFSLNQMGLEIRAGGSHSDHPTEPSSLRGN